MPNYIYECKFCGHRIDKTRKIKDIYESFKCDKCGKENKDPKIIVQNFNFIWNSKIN